MSQEDQCQPASKEEVLKVSVRVPPFWPEEPALWFAQVESQFVLSGITKDETKFYFLVAQLDHQYAKEVKDVITSPPATDKYAKLKTELIKRLSASQEKRIKQLLVHEELGDRKPSQFLRHLSSLAGSSVSSDFLLTLWSSRLPQNIQTVIASQMDLSEEKLGELADKVYEIAPTVPQVASTSTAPASLHNDMAHQISELTRQVAMLTSRLENSEKSRSRSRPKRSYRSRSRSRPRQPPEDHPYCFYHCTYGAQAKKCKQPCSFPSENSMGGRK
ncbi:hypothetical protein ABMA27_011894 [Loxostege sticticalis]|uniref:DUF7041 domain-containing protein n=1 Tax=Loxostege sticticalis TaxID=481309 RepID=A0ABR3IHW4_LOXSC